MYFLFMVCCRQLHSLIYRISSLSGKAFLGPQGHIFLLFRNLPTDLKYWNLLKLIKLLSKKTSAIARNVFKEEVYLSNICGCQ